MTSQPPHTSPGPTTQSGRDSAVRAAIWTGVLTALGGIVVAVVTNALTVWHWGENKQPNVPLTVSITSPTEHVSPGGAAFMGQIEGLQPGQTVWLFSKQLTTSAGKAMNSGIILINQGPCDIARGTWDCPKMRVGGGRPQDDGIYRVWATVIEPRQARELQNDLTQHSSVFQGSGNEPPYAGPGGRCSETLLRS